MRWGGEETDSTAQGSDSWVYVLHAQRHLDEYWTSSQNFVLFWMISETTEKPPCNLLSPQSMQEMIFYFKISKNHGTQGDPTNCINILCENLPLLFWFMSFVLIYVSGEYTVITPSQPIGRSLGAPAIAGKWGFGLARKCISPPLVPPKLTCKML